MSAERSLPKDDVVALLASALGHDKSNEVVSATARVLGIARARFTVAEVHALFDELVRLEGLVGVVARGAVSRGNVETLIAKAAVVSPAQKVDRPELRVGAPSSSSSSAPSSSSSSSSSSVPPSSSLRTFDIVSLLAPALGIEKTREAIASAAARRGIDVATGLSYSGALAVLDEMSSVEGIVGVVARFAKARFVLEAET